MTITDKYGYLHKIAVEVIFYAAVNRDNELIIYERIHNNSITICFATKEEAESVLKQIDARMKHPLFDDTAYEEARDIYQKAKEHEEKARQLNENAKRYYENVMQNDDDCKKFLNTSGDL